MARESRIVQTCGLCRQTGHNKRRCSLRPANAGLKRGKVKGRPPSVEIARETKSPEQRSAVVISTVPHAALSAHIVHLCREDRHGRIAQIPVYEEAVEERHSRASIDLARIVSNANKIAAAPSTRPVRRISERNIVSAFVRRCIRSCGAAFARAASGVAHTLQFQPEWKRVVPAALVIVIVAALPVPTMHYYRGLRKTGAEVVDASTQGFFSLHESTRAAMRADMAQAGKDLERAIQSFSRADALLSGMPERVLWALKFLPGLGERAAAGEALVSAGHHVALGNMYVVQGMEAADARPEMPQTERLEILREHLLSGIAQYDHALASLGRIDPDVLPVEYRSMFADARILFASFVEDMRDVTELSDAVRLLFGGEEFRRYIVVFQNTHEVRPTGGFMGSFAVVDVQKGRILNIEVPPGGTYDVQGQLSVYQKPPLPLQAVNKRWEMQDANWSPDFPTTAKKIAWFYEHSRGATVDGVIAVNATVLERLLGIFGPMRLAASGLELEKESAIKAIQKETHSPEARAAGAPKQVIGDGVAAVLDASKEIEKEDVLRLAVSLNDALGKKEIQIFAEDTHVQETLARFGWTGGMQTVTPDQDYVFLAVANLQGGKTDANIEQSIEHEALVAEDGSVTDTVVIRRRHAGAPDDPVYGAANIAYVRLYVPSGAEILDAGGFTYPAEESFHVPEAWYESDPAVEAMEKETRIHEASGTRIAVESGKTVFGNWMAASAGETSVAHITYRLPLRLASKSAQPSGWSAILFPKHAKTDTMRYSVYAQTQSGIASDFSSRIIFPDGWHPVWRSDDRVSLAENGGIVETTLDADMVFGLVAARRESE